MKYALVLRDFNCKIGHKQANDEMFERVHGLSKRNERGQMMADFLEQGKQSKINTFSKKKDNRKWTWIRPECKTKTYKHIVENVDVVNSCHW